ncbi:class D sortase [Tepidanaerobacter sp. GT38]|uniref:class D sortase n=1 Tax=Tepidanaerobacter sp. GT38 TaxID=2722793 RepID=UPI001F271A15|nr:class D sortase [Tepidanaerobacter sp. GT38]MCG1012739.1 class D sortase [Tepidanaerobacter sp. GT38]
MKKSLGILLIILGIITISYPKLREAYFDYQQKKLLETLTQSWENLDEYYNDVEQNPEDEPSPIEDENKAENDSDYLAKYIETHMEGILKIEKIALELPILKGATKTNLNISAASIEGTGSPGQVGNYCISAHRGRSYGRLFNRLDELEKGDLVQILQQNITYTYEVIEKLLVEAKDTWVLMPEKGQKHLTLITCDYSRKPYPRLIVKARLLDEKQ